MSTTNNISKKKKKKNIITSSDLVKKKTFNIYGFGGAYHRLVLLEETLLVGSRENNNQVKWEQGEQQLWNMESKIAIFVL